jgi:hypothetical protein
LLLRECFGTKYRFLSLGFLHSFDSGAETRIYGLIIQSVWIGGTIIYMRGRLHKPKIVSKMEVFRKPEIEASCKYSEPNLKPDGSLPGLWLTGNEILEKNKVKHLLGYEAVYGSK